MKFYNNQKNKNLFFKTATKFSSFLNNSVIKRLNIMLESQWKRHFYYKEYPLKDILSSNTNGSNIPYDDLESGSIGHRLSTSSNRNRYSSQLDINNSFSTQDQIFSNDDPIRATTSYSNLNNGHKGEHVLRTAFSLSDFKTYE
ncbi:hypothetical protein HANVADRAFT_990 [Hanseniaspora valbyensis NRRL Y-1626]|uniref:Uncharacterized protein n=1 Tax=Hanseniaspora valbyensis NRRL Y-1626 TaxID=766949 RepID=A0A1B7TI18_9ASCO|nr:hypothetical protein HANVADRAFT_990 [Hanseniaspora valbyensis NRRL Y-1626]